ncbi:MAG TPA: helix-turn-helix transcriptional regulator [Gemmataceae bacterium]|jgi:transcriptional regulator with XRE-family HTH domain
MVRALSEEQAFADKMASRLVERNIINHLMAMRTSLRMSQQDIAAKMKCTQSRVSKLENGRDDDLRMGDFHAYAEALGLRLAIVLGKKEQPPIAERIRQHVSALKRLFAELSGLVGDDDAMGKGAWRFMLRSTCVAASEVAKLLKHVAQKLPQPQKEVTSPIEIEIQDDELDPVCDSDQEEHPDECEMTASV